MFRNSTNKKHRSLAKYFIIAFFGMAFSLLVSSTGFLQYTSRILIGAYYSRLNTVGVFMFCGI